MGSIPLPALHVNPPQPQESPLDVYSKLLQFKAMGQQSELRQQEIQAGQQQNALRAQQLKDQQTIMQAQAAAQGDPKKWLPAIQGQVSPQTFMALTKSDAETREQLAKANQSELAVLKDKNDRFMGLLDQAKAMPPDQYQQAWPQILQSVEEIHPGSAAKMGLTPEQPIPQEKLALFGVGLQTQEQYIKQAQEDAAQKKRPFEQAKVEAEAAKAGSEALQEGMKADAMKQFGGLSPEMQKSRYLSIQTKMNQGQPVSPDDAAFHKAYAQEKQIVPAFNFNLQTSGGGSGAAGTVDWNVEAKKMGMSPQALDQSAEKYFSTGQLPPIGRGMAGPATNKLIMNRAAALHPDGNLAANSAEFKANEKSLENLQKQFDAVSAFEGTANRNIDVLKSTLKDIPDLGARFADVPARMISDKMLGTVGMSKFQTALATVQNEAAKILNSSNATGVLSDSARHELQAIVDGNKPIPAILGSLQILQQDFGNRHQSYQDQITDIKGRLGGKSSAQSSNTQHAPGAKAGLQEGTTGTGSDGKKYIVKGGVWVPQ